MRRHKMSIAALPAPDFRVRQQGSFTKLDALTQAAKDAPGSLFSGCTPSDPANERPGWNALPGRSTALLEALRSAGYRLAFQ